MKDEFCDNMNVRKTNRCYSDYDRRAVLCALQKGVRRGDEYLAAWAAWDLVRSGYESNFWKHIQVVALDDLAAHDDTLILIDRLKKMKGNTPYDTDLRKSMIAIKVALACARADKSREIEHGHFAFNAIAEEVTQAMKEDREPEIEHPDLKSSDKQPAIYDRHTLQGSAMGRGRRHFDVRSTRLHETTDLGSRLQSQMLEHYKKAHRPKLQPDDEESDGEDLDLTEEEKKWAKLLVSDTNRWDESDAPDGVRDK